MSVSLVRVARIYEEAVAAGRPPVKEICSQLELTTTTANRKVRAARDLGLLTETMGGVHRPATAMIHRGSWNQRTFVVCQTCLTPYPCAEVLKPDVEDISALAEIAIQE